MTRLRAAAAALVRVSPEGVLLALVKAYRVWVSPLLGPRCRFEPSCSCYAQEALARHGAWRGLPLVLWRLLRCQPLCRGG